MPPPPRQRAARRDRRTVVVADLGPAGGAIGSRRFPSMIRKPLASGSAAVSWQDLSRATSPVVGTPPPGRTAQTTSKKDPGFASTMGSSPSALIQSPAPAQVEPPEGGGSSTADQPPDVQEGLPPPLALSLFCVSDLGKLCTLDPTLVRVCRGSRNTTAMRLIGPRSTGTKRTGRRTWETATQASGGHPGRFVGSRGRSPPGRLPPESSRRWCRGLYRRG